MDYFYTIDGGNGHLAVARWDAQSYELVGIGIRPRELTENDSVYVSNVGRWNLDYLPHRIHINELRRDDQLFDMPINYSNTLGEDRLAWAFYVHGETHNRCWAIDAGSFWTVDLMEGGMRGGHILPAIDSCSRLYGEGAKLKAPGQQDIYNATNMIAQDTPKAISNGVRSLYQSYLQAIVGDGEVYCCGGGAHQVSALLNGQINLVDHGVHRGLARAAKFHRELY